MDKIFKYNIAIVSAQVIELPVSARILTVMAQRDTVVLYVIINDAERAKERRVIEIFGTGHPISNTVSRNYIGTVQQDNGYQIWHVFERVVSVDGTCEVEGIA